MKYIHEDKLNRKENENIIEGVDVFDKEAVKKKYNELKVKRAFMNMIFLVLFAIIGFCIYEFWNINSNGSEPTFTIKLDVDNGVQYVGLGYKKIVCDDGTIYLNENKDCLETGQIKTFDDLLYKALNTYLYEEKVVNKNFSKFTINSYESDEKLEDKSTDYYVNITYECKNGKSDCFKEFKKMKDNNVSFYISLDKNNTVIELFEFKNTGSRYDNLVLDYKEKVRTYLINDNKYVSDDVRHFNIELVEYYGIYEYNNVVYEDSYKIKVSYLCNDDTVSCVTSFGNDIGNLVFELYMFLDRDNEVVLLESTNNINME